MRNKTVSEKTRAMTPLQRRSVEIIMMRVFPADLSFDEAESIFEARGEFGRGIREAFEPFIRTKPVLYWLDEMMRFYKEVFDLKCDYSKLRAPVPRERFDWLLVADHRVGAQTAFDKCQERFRTCKSTDSSLDVAVPTNDRSQKDGDYAIWLRNQVEADEEHRSKSARDLKAVAGITLRERLMLELWYEWKRDQHLDVENYTLCSGSRDDCGNVPSVRWHPVSGVSLGRRSIGESCKNLRCREAGTI